jgi:hypothetical protein
VQRPEDVWAGHSKPVLAKPHKRDVEAWKVIKQVSSGPSEVSVEQ